MTDTMHPTPQTPPTGQQPGSAPSTHPDRAAPLPGAAPGAGPTDGPGGGGMSWWPATEPEPYQPVATLPAQPGGTLPYQGGGVVPPTAPPAPVPGPGAGRPGRRMLVGAVALALALAGGAGGGALATRLADPRVPAAVVSASTVAAGGALTLADVATAVSPSVVTIAVDTRGGSATGSGVILTDTGRILTNNHVVEGAMGVVSVHLADGRTVTATVVGTDPATDLAVLQAAGVSGLTPASLGDSSAVRVGDTVLALGSPLGLEGTVTAGIVSAVDRSTDSLTGLIQTDAPINAGSSGGAVVDTAGRVVGITVAIATTGADSGNIGVGFAIPSDTVATVVDRLVGAAS